MHPSNYPVSGLPLSTASLPRGRDGSPSRPFAAGHAYLDQLPLLPTPNGGLGEPRPTLRPLQKTTNQERRTRLRCLSVFPTANRQPLPPRGSATLGRDGSPTRPFAAGHAYLDQLPILSTLNGGLGEPRPTSRPLQKTTNQERRTPLAPPLFIPNRQPPTANTSRLRHALP